MLNQEKDVGAQIISKTSDCKGKVRQWEQFSN